MKSNDTFINKVARYILSNYNLKNDSLTVVFPNKRAAFFLRNEMRKLASETIWMPKIMSIEEVVSQWSGLELADKLDVIFELVAIENDMNKCSNANLSQFGGKASQMASDFDDVDNYMINAKDLFNYVTSEKKIGMWDVSEMNPKEKENEYIKFYQSLYSYYTRLRERLLSKKKGYYGMLTRMLAETSDDAQLKSAIKGDKVVFAGFNALTRCEETIIDKLVKLGIATTLWDFDSYYVDDPKNEAGTFARELKEKHPDWFHADFDISNNMLSKERTVKIIDASGNTLQAKALQEQLSMSANANEAIVLVNEDLLIPVLNSMPQSIGDRKIKISMGYPIRLTPVNGLTNLYFKMHRRRFANDQLYIWPILEIFSLDIVKLTFGNDELDKMNAWRKNMIWQKQYTVSIDDLGLGKDSDIEKLIRLMTGATKNVVELLDNLRSVVTLFGQKTENIKSQEGRFYRTQINEAYKTISRIDDILKQHSDYVTDNETVESLYKIVSRENSIKLVSEKDTDEPDNDKGGIQIMGLLETRNLDFDCIHLLNVNEGSLPKNNSQGSFIPYFIRCYMGMPSNEKKQSVFAYHFYRLLQNCSNVNIYYNSDNESEDDRSRFVMQIERELVPMSNGKTKLSVKHFTNKNAPSDTLVSPISIKKTEPVIKKLKQKLEDSISPSTLQQYVTCPLKFCFRYVYEIENNDVDENVQANAIGTYVHDVLKEILFDKFGNSIINKDLLEQIKAEAKERLKNIDLPQNAYNILNETVIRNFVMNYLEKEKGGFAVVGAETEMCHNIEVNGIICNIKGTIDRIDKLSDGSIRISDYKTDKKIDKKDTLVNNDMTEYDQIPEKARQLMIYKYLYLKNNSNVKPENVGAAIINLTHHSDLYFNLVSENESLNKDFENTLEGIIKDFLAKILDPNEPFVQDTTNKKCIFCDYRKICMQDIDEKW